LKAGFERHENLLSAERAATRSGDFCGSRRCRRRERNQRYCKSDYSGFHLVSSGLEAIQQRMIPLQKPRYRLQSA